MVTSNPSKGSEEPPSGSSADARDGGPSMDVEERPLTFQPALDDTEKLKAFLRGVCEKYYAEREEMGMESVVEQGGLNASSVPQGGSNTSILQASAPTESTAKPNEETKPPVKPLAPSVEQCAAGPRLQEEVSKMVCLEMLCVCLA